MNTQNKIMLGSFMVGFVVLLGVNVLMAENTNSIDKTAHVKDPAILKQKQNVLDALNNSDYGAWVSALSENKQHPKILDKINADNFPTYVAFHNAIKNRDFATAKTLGDQLGLKTHQKLFMKGYRMGVKDGLREGKHLGRNSGPLNKSILKQAE